MRVVVSRQLRRRMSALLPAPLAVRGQMGTLVTMSAVTLLRARARSMRRVLASVLLPVVSTVVLAAFLNSCGRANSPLALAWQREHTAEDDLWNIRALAFSPDGQLLAVGNGMGST